MARNTFDNPYSAAPRPVGPAPAGAPAAMAAPAATMRSEVERIAAATKVPPALIVAMTEGGDGFDPLMVEQRATALGQRLATGTKASDALGELTGDPATGRAMMERARAIEAQEWGPDRSGNTLMGDAARTLGGTAINMIGGGLEAAGRIVEGEIEGYLAHNSREQDKKAGRAEPSRRTQEREAAKREDGPLLRGAKTLGDAVSGIGERMAENVNPVNRDASADFMPKGDIMDPSTWEAGDMSLRGGIMQAAQIAGSMAPVVAAAIGTRGAAIPTMVGGLTGAGAGGDEAADAVQREFDEGRLQETSPFYADLIANGDSPAAALEKTKDAAAQGGTIRTAPVSALGGLLTGGIIRGAVGARGPSGLAGRTAQAAGTSALEEGVQEVAEGVAARTGANDTTGADINVFDDSLPNAVMGALGGGQAGALAGAASGRQPVDGLDDAVGDTPSPAGARLALPAPALTTPPSGGPIEAAARAAPPPVAPIAEAEVTPPAFPDMKPGAQVDILTEDSGRRSVTFLSEGPDGVSLRVDGKAVTIPADMFGAAVDAARATGTERFPGDPLVGEFVPMMFAGYDGPTEVEYVDGDAESVTLKMAGRNITAPREVFAQSRQAAITATEAMKNPPAPRADPKPVDTGPARITQEVKEPAAEETASVPDEPAVPAIVERAAEPEVRRPQASDPFPKDGLSVRIGDRTFPVSDLAQASKKVRATIEKMGIGRSEKPRIDILDRDGNEVGMVSYGGVISDTREGVDRSFPPTVYAKWTPEERAYFDEMDAVWMRDPSDPRRQSSWLTEDQIQNRPANPQPGDDLPRKPDPVPEPTADAAEPPAGDVAAEWDALNAADREARLRAAGMVTTKGALTRGASGSLTKPYVKLGAYVKEQLGEGSPAEVSPTAKPQPEETARAEDRQTAEPSPAAAAPAEDNVGGGDGAGTARGGDAGGGRGRQADAVPEDAAPVPEPEGPSANGLTAEENAELEALRAEMADMMRNQLRSGIDPNMIRVGVKIAALRIKGGSRRFKAFLDEMLGLAASVGASREGAARAARVAYNEARDDAADNGADMDGFDDSETVRVMARDAGREPEADVSPDVAEPATVETGETADGDENADGIGSDSGDQSRVDAGTPEDRGDVGDAGAEQAGPGTREDGGSRDGDADGDVSDRPVGSVERGGADGTREPAADAKGRASPKRSDSPDLTGINYVIPAEMDLGGGTDGQRLKANMEALRIALELEKSGDIATPEQQENLARYVGWGGLTRAFKDDETGQWKAAHDELKSTLTPKQFNAAQASTPYAFYTPKVVTEAMWSIMDHMGFKGGRVLEPTVGSGNFLGLQPRGPARAATEWHAVEKDPVTGMVAKHLYPEAEIIAGVGFEKADFSDGSFDAAIGNPPFGSLTIKDKSRPDLDGMNIHNYIMGKTGRHLRPGGVMAMMITHRFLDTPDAKGRAALAETFDFLGAVRLPNNAFGDSAVVTDLVLMRKRHPGDTAPSAPAWLDTNGALADGTRVNRYFAENPDLILGRSAMDGTMYGAGKKDGEYTVHPDGRSIPAAIRDAVAGPLAGIKDAMGDRAEALADAASGIDSEAIGIGGMALRDGQVVRREEGRLPEVLTADSLWNDEARNISQVERAITAYSQADTDALRESRADALRDAAGFLYLLSGDRPAKPNAIAKAVFDLIDAIAANRVSPKVVKAARTEAENALGRRKVGEERLARIKGMLELREMTLAQVNMETRGADGIEANRKALNKAYDAFVAKFGAVNASKNKSAMQGDIGVETGLEEKYEAGEKGAPDLVEKSKMLEKRVLFEAKATVKAETPEDALTASLVDRGKVDLDHMAGLLGMDVATVQDALAKGDEPRIYRDPATDTWVDAETYLSGNVKAKLARALDTGLMNHADALEKALPADLPQSRIVPSIRAQWIPEDVFQGFLADLGIINARVVILPDVGLAQVTGQIGTLSDFGQQFAHDRKNVVEMMQAAMAGKAITISDRIDDKLVKNEEATKEVNAIMQRMAEAFRDWAYADTETAGKVVDAYNKKMNTHVPRKYDGEKFLKTVGMSMVKPPRRTQKNGAWRMMQERFTLLDHVVGAGKSITAIMAVMERRRLGLSRKPMIVVPNHLVGQWRAEFLEVYPGAHILAASPADFEASKRKAMMSRIATGDYDAIIMAHSSFGMIPAQDGALELVAAEEIEMLREADKTLKAAGERGASVKTIGKRIEKAQAKIDAAAEKRRDEIGLNMGSLGIDYLVVDESQGFKNLAYTTTGEPLVGMNAPAGSERAFDLYAKMRGLNESGGGGAFLTGTPISNSLVEVYTVLKYLAHNDLKSRGLLSFDAFSSAYVNAETRFEYTATGKLKERRVLASMSNLDSLWQLYGGVSDTVARPDLERIYAEQVRAENKAKGTDKSERFPTPNVKGGGRQLLSAPATESQRKFVDYLVARMAKIKEMGKEWLSIDNALVVLTDARKAALDMRTVDPGLERDPDGKVARAGREILRVREATKKDRGTQLVFSDLSTPLTAARKTAAGRLKRFAQVVYGRDEAKKVLEAGEGTPLLKQWKAINEKAEETIADETTADRKRDALEDFIEKEQDGEAEMFTMDTGFSAYDDLKAFLIEEGVPEKEIAFIHDYEGDVAKKKLYARMNDGRVRVLIGSTPKLGAGTNVQERLVALHHLDAPWRPSDVEQREGRIIRQGNKLYQADPEGFEVEILAYSTAGSSDTVLWQILERKARGIESFRAGGADEVVEDGGDANDFASFMASSTGNPVFLLKMEQDAKVDKLKAEVSGKLLGKNSAISFLRTYAEKLAGAQSWAKSFSGMDPSTITFRGNEGPSSDFMDAVGEVQAVYEEKLATWEKKIKEVEADREEAQKAGAKDLPNLPGKPAYPQMTSDEFTGRSKYSRVVKSFLTEGSALSDGQSVSMDVAEGRIVLRRRDYGSGNASRKQFILSAEAGAGKSLEIGRSEATDLTKAPSLMTALNPARLKATIESEAAYHEQRAESLKAEEAEQKRKASTEVDTTNLAANEAVLKYYEAEVRIAEGVADARRASEPNVYIERDPERASGGSSSEALTDTPTVEYGGDTYVGVGEGVAPQYGMGMTLRRMIRQSDGESVMVQFSNGNPDMEKAEVIDVMETPEQAKIEMEAARQSRTVGLMRRIEAYPDALRDVLADRLAATGLAGKVSLRISDSLVGSGPIGRGVKLDGMQRGRLIAVAMDAADPTATLDHEIIHALRDSAIWGKPQGLFSDIEWKALVRAARSDRAKMQEIAARYPDLTTAQQVEEAVADMYGAWRRGDAPKAAPASLMQRIRDVIGAIGGALRGAGFTTAEEVMSSIASGDVGRRGGAGPSDGGVARQSRTADPYTGGISPTLADRLGEIGGGTKKWATSAGEWVADVVRAPAGQAEWLMGLVPGQALMEEMGTFLPSVQKYRKMKITLDAERNEWQSKTATVADNWRKMMGKNAAANRKMMDLMHQSTIAQTDPSKDYESMPAAVKVKEAIDDSKGQIRVTPWMSETLAADARRKRTHDRLAREFEALPKAFRDVFQEVRDTHAAMGTAFEDAAIENVKASQEIGAKVAERTHKAEMERIKDDRGMTPEEKKTATTKADERLANAKAQVARPLRERIAKLRESLEANKLMGPYFPLSRFGPYFVTLRAPNGDVMSFSRFETEGQQKRFVDGLTPVPGQKVQTGILKESTDMEAMVSPAFVAEMQDVMGPAATPEVMDAIWQRWLETMPDFSLRKNRIHRKGREGYTGDAYRAFAHQMFHGAHQVARLRNALRMSDAINDAAIEAADSSKPEQNGRVVRELVKRHNFTMAPTGGPIAAGISSLAFVWYLSATPAAAIVNLSQTTINGIPILSAANPEAGVKGTAAELARASRHFVAGRGATWKDTVSAANADALTAEEKAAMEWAYETGVADKTQSHELAAIKETGIAYNSTRERVMKGISFFFHHAERMNREVTFLAAYRLARKAGKTDEAARDQADILTKRTHFSYQSTDRPRFMQNDTARILLIFRQHTINMLWRLVRDTDQAFRGDTPEARREARAQVLGITLSMMAHAGIRGTWGYGLLTMLFGFGDGDEADEKLRDLLLVEGDGASAAAWNFTMGMALNGAPGHLTGVSLTERIGMPNLWFRGAYRDMEGADLAKYYINELLGPGVGLIASTARGVSMASDGEIWKGTETMAPKALRDLSRAVRYTTDGVTTRNGDLLLDDISPYQAFVQALGFTPAEVAERYDVNGRMKTLEQRIIKERSGLHRDLGDAIRSGETVGAGLIKKVEEFNRRVPSYPITADSLKSSIQSRARSSARNEFGIQLNPRLNAFIREDRAPMLYG